MSRRSLSGKDYSSSRGIMGSYESLASIGADSVITNNYDPKTSTPPNPHCENGKVNTATQFSPRCESEKVATAAQFSRSPINSTSSLELSPGMDQVCERLATSHLTTPPQPLVTHSELHMLWPQPRRIIELTGPQWIPPSRVTLGVVAGPVSVHKIVDIWDVHKPELQECGCNVSLEGVLGPQDSSNSHHVLTCAVDSSLTTMQSEYRLFIKHTGVKIVCGSLGSLHSALVTLVQLLRVFNHSSTSALPPLIIMDSPSLSMRGFMMDASPFARVPTLERLCQVVDSLVSIKINQLHLLLRLVTSITATTCSLPYIPSELVSLERYCCDRGIQLVPVFDLDASSPLSVHTVFPAIMTTLNHFSSTRLVHLGPGLSSVLADASVSSTNESFWSQLNIPKSVSLMVCNNVFHNNPRGLAQLPPRAILVEYGFQADYDFTVGAKSALEAGRSVIMCPGTAAWSSLSGWPEAGVSNVYSGTASGMDTGASGLIVAHWSSTGSLTPLVFSWPPLIVAAGLAWNHNTHWDYVHSSVGALIDTHLVHVPSFGLGAALVELGRCETWLTRVARGQETNDPANLPSSNPGSTLHQLLADPDCVSVDHLSTEVFACVMRHVRKAVRQTTERSASSDRLPSSWPFIDIAVLELHLAMDMMLTACRLGRALVTVGTNPRSNMGVAVVNPGVAHLPPTLRTDLANKVLALREVYTSVWLKGFQPTGLQASLLVLTSLLTRLLPEQTVHDV